MSALVSISIINAGDIRTSSPLVRDHGTDEEHPNPIMNWNQLIRAHPAIQLSERLNPRCPFLGAEPPAAARRGARSLVA